MISVLGREWSEKKVNTRLIEKIQQENDFPQLLSKLIVSRNFDNEEINSIKNNFQLINVFQKTPDFLKSTDVLIDTINNNEMICILGDYDVDGSAATSLLIKFFENIKHPYFYYIPDREKDGYGASKNLFEKLILKKPKLIIMVDCGSSSLEAVNFLNKNNIKSLIIDHHEIDKPYPKSNAIINPKKNNGYLKYDYLCATTLTYFFIEILIKKIGCKFNLRKYLIYVLLATVCDVMPLRKLNRLISIIALKEFDIEKNLFFKEIYKLSNKKNKINISDLGYLVGPILNSGGRLGKSNYATELLFTNNESIILDKSLKLFNLNKKRKEIEKKILKEINFDKIKNENNDVIIFYKPNLNEGLIGIIAAKLVDYFNKPSIVITTSNDFLKGSARSVFNYNIGRVIKNSYHKKIIINGGGHNMAAGFTLRKKNLSIFKEFIIKDFLKNKISIAYTHLFDSEISALSFNKNFYDDIKRLGPFGNGNSNPIFLIKEIKIIKSKILDKKHISCILKTKTGLSINSISFNSLNTMIGKYLLNYKKKISVLGQINENFWNNKKTLQLIIKDVIL